MVLGTVRRAKIKMQILCDGSSDNEHDKQLRKAPLDGKCKHQNSLKSFSLWNRKRVSARHSRQVYIKFKSTEQLKSMWMFHEFNGMFRRRHESVRRTENFSAVAPFSDCFLIARSDDVLFVESLETCWNARRGTMVWMWKRILSWSFFWVISIV